MSEVAIFFLLLNALKSNSFMILMVVSMSEWVSHSLIHSVAFDQWKLQWMESVDDAGDIFQSLIECDCLTDWMCKDAISFLNDIPDWLTDCDWLSDWLRTIAILFLTTKVTITQIMMTPIIIVTLLTGWQSWWTATITKLAYYMIIRVRWPSLSWHHDNYYSANDINEERNH